MSRLLIIGCGGVAGVAIHKCCQNSDVFTEICIASRTKSKCHAIKANLENTTKTTHKASAASQNNQNTTKNDLTTSQKFISTTASNTITSIEF